jgi:PAS domain S-box-containing protein
MTDRTIVILDALGTIRYCSDPLLFGGNAEQLCGRPLAALIPTLALKDRQPGYNVSYAQVWWSDGPWRYHALRTLDGRSLSREVCLRTVVIDRKQRLLVVLRSPPEPARQSRSMQRLFLAAETWVESCFITALDGVIAYANSAFERLTGYRRADITGLRTRMLTSGNHWSEVGATLKAGRTYRAVVQDWAHNGAYKSDMTVRPFVDDEGKVTHPVSTGRVVAERSEQAAR